MAINPNNICTFGDLIEYAKEQIMTKCHNIDAYSSNVPALYKNGTVDLKTASVGVLYYGTSGNFRPAPSNPHRAAYTARTRVSSSADTLLKIVPSSVVESDLLAFMDNRGLSAKFDSVLSFKAVINFFQNLSAFMEYRIVEVFSPYSGVTGIFFYHHPDSEVEYNDELYKAVEIQQDVPTYTNGEECTYFEPVLPFDIDNPQYLDPVTVDVPDNIEDKDVEFNKNQLINSVHSFINNLNSINGIHHVQVTVTVNCCSCSSSSSSSSSSCSSSSSAFIVYMDI